MDSLFFAVIVLGIFVAVVGPIIWWLLIGYGIYKLVRHWESDLKGTESMLRNFKQAPVQERQLMHPQILAQLSRLQSQYQQLDDLHRQRYEVRVSELQGMAAQAGIDWSPPPYS